MAKKKTRRKRTVTTNTREKQWTHPKGAPREDMEFLAKELSAFMGLKPAIDHTLPDDDLIEKIKEAEAMFFEDDVVPREIKLSLNRVNRYIGDTWVVPRVVSTLMGDIDYGDEDMDGKEFLEEDDVLDPDAEPLEEEEVLEAIAKEKFIKPTPANPEDLEAHREELEKRKEVVLKKKKAKKEHTQKTPGVKMGRPKTIRDPDYEQALAEARAAVEVPMLVKRKGKRFLRGSRNFSAHSVAVELLCENPDMTELEIYQELAKRRVAVPEGNHGVKSAQIMVRRVVGLLRKHGKML